MAEHTQVPSDPIAQSLFQFAFPIALMLAVTALSAAVLNAREPIIVALAFLSLPAAMGLVSLGRRFFSEVRGSTTS